MVISHWIAIIMRASLTEVVSKVAHLLNTKVRFTASPMAFTAKCSMESESKGTSFLTLAAFAGNLLATMIAKPADSV